MDRCDNEKPVTSEMNIDGFAYSQLVKDYSARIFAICFGMLSNRADAEDVTQQVFLKGFSDIKQLRDKNKFGPWITQIAKHICLDQLRKRKLNNIALKQMATNDSKEEINYDEDHSRLQLVLEQLTEEYRVPLMLFYFDGQSTKKIAETLEITVATAQTRLSRARQKLREILSTEGGEQ